MALYIGAVSYAYTIYAFALYGLMLHRLDPDSYKGIQATSAIVEMWEFLYYSVVTITTLGYGDINPESFTAQYDANCGLRHQHQNLVWSI